MNRRDFLQPQFRSTESSLRTRITSGHATLQSHADAGFGKSQRTLSSTSLAQWSPQAGEWNLKKVNHLYHRAGFGATKAELDAALQKSFATIIDAMLSDHPMPAAPAYSDEWIDAIPLQNPTQAEAMQQGQRYQYANLAIRRWWGMLMSQPETMLREKMALFWMNHFVVESEKVYFPQMMYRYLDYFRRNPWGNVKQMVKDMAVTPAMLMYLDGAQSYRGKPNENFARELLELFTMGVVDKDGQPNYTEDDIKEVAKAFTGFSVNPRAAGLSATYIVNRHDSAFKQPFAAQGLPKKQYGLYNSLSAQYETEANDVVDAIFSVRGDKIAYFICGKLYQYFVYHNIDGATEKAIVSELAEGFKQNWDVKALLAKLLKSEHFYDEGNIGAALKSPYEWLVGITRQLDIKVDELSGGTVHAYCVQLEQQLLDPPNVKGWPGYRSWISTTTLPNRNLIATQLLLRGNLPFTFPTGYNSENFGPLTWDNASVTKWAKQFASYKSSFVDFVSEVTDFLCAIRPAEDVIYSRVVLKFPPNYEWTQLSDTDRISAVRQVVNQIMLLAQYQLA